MGVRQWHGGVRDRALGALMAVGVACLLYSDIGRIPPWWELIAQASSALTLLPVAYRALTFRATADATGLHVRTGRRTRTLPWPDIATATAGPGTTMRIRLTGRCPQKDVHVHWSGLRPPKRAAAEITAMAADPSLRP